MSDVGKVFRAKDLSVKVNVPVTTTISVRSGEYVTRTRPGPFEHLPACNDKCEADRHYMATAKDEFRRLTPDELKDRGRWHVDEDTPA